MSRFLKYFACLSFLVFTNPAGAQEKVRDYADYHKRIIEAEYYIFIQKDSIKGLKTFDNVFRNYEFVFVDDCIEAFQLACQFRQEQYALRFIRKALDNGFELQLLDMLTAGCPCNFYQDARNKVTVCRGFLEKHRASLEQYFEKVHPAYVSRLDKELMKEAMKRHVREQLFKNGHKGLVMGMSEEENAKEQERLYKAICDDNLAFIDSLGRKGVLPGEWNLGIYTDRLVKELGIPGVSDCTATVLRHYGLPGQTAVPVIDQLEYFDKGMIYNMLFHNVRSYETLVKYGEDAIRKGRLHPRELASLQFNYSKKPNRDKELFLQPGMKQTGDTVLLNRRRAEMFLPSWQADEAKHAFAHRYGLKLFFGMFNGTR